MKTGTQIADWKVYSLELGRLRLDGGAMFGVVPKVMWEKRAPADSANRIQLNMRCLLLKSADRVVLVDTGMGLKDPEKFRRIFNVEQPQNVLLQQLEACGVQASEVSDIILTHLHFDHCGGCFLPGEEDAVVAQFPGAQVHLQRQQWEWAQKRNPRDRASYLPRNFEALDTQYELQLHEGDGEIIPGIHVRCVNGHTPMMQLVHLPGDPGLLYLADLVPSRAHLPMAWVMGYDLEPLKTVEEKKRLYAEFIDGKTWLAFEHDPEVAAVVCKAGEREPEIIRSLEFL